MIGKKGPKAAVGTRTAKYRKISEHNDFLKNGKVKRYKKVTQVIKKLKIHLLSL